ncbi:MAG: cytochrome c oxidase subunit II [Verrucomicrobia bacterium]|nr:cytochrome c oxidase subunit II [Verrucomicrobiota bacterium]
MGEFLGSPLIGSEHGASVDNLSWLIHLLMAVLFVGWLVYFGIVLFKFRANRHPRANPEGVKHHASNYIEIAVAVIEAVLLGALAIPLWRTAVAAWPEEKDSTVIGVMGRQFNWTAHYAGPDGVFGKKDPKLVSASDPFGIDRQSPGAADDVVVVNDFVVPVNKPVIAKITSQDVIHSFAVRPMRVTQDAIPGLMIPVHFKPIRTGTNLINCVQLCGNSHYAMKGTLAVVTQKEFDDWLASKSKTAPKAPVNYE